MARKKVLFIIVEGPSDDEALGLIFTRLFQRTMFMLKLLMVTLHLEMM